MAIRYEDVEEGGSEVGKPAPKKKPTSPVDTSDTTEEPAALPYGKPVRPEKKRKRK